MQLTLKRASTTAPLVGAAMTGKNRIMIYGPKDDGTYVVEFRTAEGEALRPCLQDGA